jgi:hypothetical protein
LAEIESDFEAAGRRWTRATATSKATVIRILDEIAAQGLTLEQVWEGYQSGKTDRRGAGKKLAEAIQEVCEAKKAANRRPVYLAELGRYLRLFARGREAMDVAKFGVVELESWFSERRESPASRVGNLGKLRKRHRAKRDGRLGCRTLSARGKNSALQPILERINQGNASLGRSPEAGTGRTSIPTLRAISSELGMPLRRLLGLRYE